MGSIVDVKPGYARNFLVPHRLAEIATEGSLQNAIRLGVIWLLPPLLWLPA